MGDQIRTIFRVVITFFPLTSFSKAILRAAELPSLCKSDRVRKKMENYAEIFGNIMRKKVTIMRKRCQIMQKFLKLIKLSPWLFLAYKIRVNVLPRIELL